MQHSKRAMGTAALISTAALGSVGCSLARGLGRYRVRSTSHLLIPDFDLLPVDGRWLRRPGEGSDLTLAIHQPCSSGSWAGDCFKLRFAAPRVWHRSSPVSQAGRQAGRQADGQTDRQTHRDRDTPDRPDRPETE